jgi:beta-N-acetylhexosaminidase
LKYLLFFLLISDAFSKVNYTLEHEISQLLLFGFKGSRIQTASSIKKDIEAGLGAVILFDRRDKKCKETQNIKNPSQLRDLLTDLQAISSEPLLICIDQEGGRVDRLKSKRGFINIPSASFVGKHETFYSRMLYDNLAQEFDYLGINCVFAPVVDLACEPKNPVIYQLDRAFSNDPDIVIEHASNFLDAMREKNIFSIIKHFPGHGSSLADSHKGFVDVSDTWKKVELEPFFELVKSNKVEMIMTAHIFNKHLDAKYPATMSYRTNTILLKKQIGFKGLMISDGLQMRAIRDNYDLETVVEKTLNSGVDMLLFANQLGFNTREEIVGVVKKLIKEKKISELSIREKAQQIRDYKARILKKK